MSELQKLPNIGKYLETKLLEVGIDTPEKLIATGTEQTFLKLQTVDESVCIRVLYGIEGAIEGIKDSELSSAKKGELTSFFRMLNKQGKCK